MTTHIRVIEYATIRDTTHKSALRSCWGDKLYFEFATPRGRSRNDLAAEREATLRRCREQCQARPKKSTKDRAQLGKAGFDCRFQTKYASQSIERRCPFLSTKSAIGNGNRQSRAIGDWQSAIHTSFLANRPRPRLHPKARPQHRPTANRGGFTRIISEAFERVFLIREPAGRYSDRLRGLYNRHCFLDD